MLGNGFDVLPFDAIGVPMIANDRPLEYRDTIAPQAIMEIVERSDTRIVVRSGTEVIHAQSSIGALVSSDRSVVYWVNDTNPLP